MTQLGKRKLEKLERLAELSAINAGERGESLWREAFKRLRRNPTAIFGACILVLFVLIAIIGPFLVPYEPKDTRWIGQVSASNNIIPGPSAQHWAGYAPWWVNHKTC